MTDALVFVLSLAGVAVFVVCLTTAAMFVQRWKIEGENEENHIRQQERYDRPAYVSEVDGRAIAPRLHAIAHQLHAQKEQSRRQDRKRSSREIITIVALISAGLFALGSDGLLFWQLIVAKQAAVTQHDDTVAALNLSTSTAAAQIQQMTAQADAAKTQADAAKTAAETAQDSLVSGSRAWVGPIDAHFDGTTLTSGTDASVDIVYLNTGREPARSFTFTVYKSFALTQADASEAIGENLQKCTASHDVSASQVVYPAVGLGGGSQMKIAIPGADVDDDLIKGHKTLVVLGCMTYFTFGEVRHSAFCFYYQALDTKLDHFGYCTEGGYAD
jgi:hypothetical protein